MKITFVISSLSGGGAERILSNIANYWAEAGHKITVLTFDNGNSIFYPLLKSVQWRPLNIAEQSNSWIGGMLNSLKRIRCLRKAIKKSKPDFIISFLYTTNVLTILATCFLSYPVIVSERNAPGYYRERRSVWHLLRRLLYPLAVHLVVQTNEIKNYFKRYNRSVRIIPNLLMIPAEKLVEDTEVQLPPGKKIIAMGRFVRQKGFDMLIDVFARLCKYHSGWNLVILGDGCLMDVMRKRIEELNIGRAVFMPGRVSNPFSILARCDLFVLSSRYEGFPNSLLEAMACGLPVVSFECPSGPGDIIQHGVNGLLVRSEDTNALEKAIHSLMEDEVLRERMGRNAKKVIERFSPEKIMKQWDELIYNKQSDSNL